VRLVVVRHGATTNNAEGRYTGQTDIPMSPLGSRQVEAVADALAGERFDLMLASDLLRARQAAETIARRVEAPLEFDRDLREIAMGAWEGLKFGEAAREYPVAWKRWREAPELTAPPGGESVTHMRDRAASALDRCLVAHPAGRVLWVTHGGVIGVVLCHLLGIDLQHRGQFRRDNAAITELEVRPDATAPGQPDPLPGRGAGQILRLNDTHHLAGLPASESDQVL
jgi:broad specificity phosphatase PhoE